MGHHISAAILKGPIDTARAKALDMRTIDLDDKMYSGPGRRSFERNGLQSNRQPWVGQRTRE